MHRDKLRSYSIYHQAVRRVKGNGKKHEAENLLEATLHGDLNLLKEIKKIKNLGWLMDELLECVDGAKMRKI